MNKAERIPYLHRAKNGRWKYQRRVPIDAQPWLFRDKWDLSLGSDFVVAVDRARKLTKEHDCEIFEFTDLEEMETRTRQVIDTFEDTLHQKSLINDGYSIKTFQNQWHWRRTEEMLQHGDVDKLVVFATVALDVKLEREINRPNLVTVLKHIKPDVPTGRDKLIFDAMQGAIKARISELTEQRPQKSEHRLSVLREKYISLKGLQDSSARGMRTKTNRLIDCLGDLELSSYSPKRLREYRDLLVADELTPSTIAAYFTATKTVMNWAIKEDLVPDFNYNPCSKVTMPTGGKTIEERRWQRFDDSEIKKVWTLLKDEWGPSSKSKFSIERREAFLMVFRILLYTGLRPIEVFWLRDHGTVTTTMIDIRRTKTKIPRKLPLSKHICDFTDFMEADGLAACGKATSAASTMSEAFTKIIRQNGFTNSRHVLYSAKDTLVDRLQRLPGGMGTDDVIRGVIGHVGGQGHLRNYKTRLNDSPEGFAMLRSALDSIRYW